MKPGRKIKKKKNFQNKQAHQAMSEAKFNKHECLYKKIDRKEIERYIYI